MIKERDFSNDVVQVVRKVTWVGFWINAVLMTVKIVFGIMGHSDALVADGIHSLSDFATDFIVIVMIGIAYKTADVDHPYGHGKYETFATLLIGVALGLVALGIGISGIYTVVNVLKGEILEKPELVTLWIAIGSVVCKEILFRYTFYKGKKVKSASLVANAWHHRSDAYSSVATVLGIGASILLGEKWRILDPIASVMISIFILAAAYKICQPAIKELLETSLPEEAVSQIEFIVSDTPGVINFHKLRTRRNGRYKIIDVHIKVDGNLSVIKGHEIASDLEVKLKEIFGDETISNIHVEPYCES